MPTRPPPRPAKLMAATRRPTGVADWGCGRSEAAGKEIRAVRIAITTRRSVNGMVESGDYEPRSELDPFPKPAQHSRNWPSPPRRIVELLPPFDLKQGTSQMDIIN